MGLHKLCCYLRGGSYHTLYHPRWKYSHSPAWNYNQHFLQSFTRLKLQSAFPTVWLGFFRQSHLYTALAWAYNSQCENLLKTVFCINFWHGQNFFSTLYHICCLFRWSTPQNQHPWPCDYHTDFLLSCQSWPKFWSWQTNMWTWQWKVQSCASPGLPAG